jgi:hypothetical protein
VLVSSRRLEEAPRRTTSRPPGLHEKYLHEEDTEMDDKHKDE